jgi:hypothetical protein
MKTIIINVLIALALIQVNGQNYIPFPLPGAEWKFAYYNLENPYGGCEYYYNKIEGDTVIGNYTYKKVFETALNGNEYFYKAGIRQDALTGKVYVKLYDNYFCGETDTLLYDFSLQVGDTLKQCHDITGGCDDCSIIDVDSINLGNYWLKRAYTNNGFSIIEGIGCTGGLIDGWSGWEFGYTILSCYSINGEPVFPDSTCIMTEINYNFYPNKSLVNIFPNPATSFITINVIGGQPIDEAIIYNHLGQKVLVAVPVNNTVDVSKQKPGMYMVEVFTKENQARQKLVIK